MTSSSVDCTKALICRCVPSTLWRDPVLPLVPYDSEYRDNHAEIMATARFAAHTQTHRSESSGATMHTHKFTSSSSCFLKRPLPGDRAWAADAQAQATTISERASLLKEQSAHWSASSIDLVARAQRSSADASLACYEAIVTV